MSHSRTLLFALTLCPIASLPLQAQPQTEQAKAVKAGQDEQIARTAWRDLQKATSRLELSEPAQAIEVYQQFYQASGNRYPDIAVAVTSRIAQLWGRNLKNPTKAGEIYAWALEQWGETPYKERLQREAAAMAKLGGTAAVAVKAPTFGVVVPMMVEQVGVKPLTVTPFTIAPTKTVGVGAPLISGGTPVRVGLQMMLAEITAGQLSVQQAHERGSLTVDDALHLLDGVGAWGNLAGGDRKTRRELAMLVVAQDPKQLEAPEKLPPNVRLWLGDALAEVRDDRSVALLENVLNELREKKLLIDEKDVTRAFVTTEHLAAYYSENGQSEKAAQTWIASSQLLANAKMGKANNWMLLEANLSIITERSRDNAISQESVNSFKQLLAISPDFAPTALNSLVTLMLYQGKFSTVTDLLNDDAIAHSSQPSLRASGISLQGKMALLQGSKSQAKEFWIQAQNMAEKAKPFDPEWEWCRDNSREGLEILELFETRSLYVPQPTISLDPNQSSSAEFEIWALQPLETSIVPSSDKVRVVAGDWQLKISNLFYSKKLEIHLDSVGDADEITLALQHLPTGQVEELTIRMPVETEGEDIDLW